MSEFQLTFQSGGFPDSENHEHPAKLQMAACNGDKKSLKKLVENATSEMLDATDHLGQTPLMHCILRNDVECALILLKAGVRVDNTDNTGQTALHMAVNKGLYRCVKLLLSNGAMWNQLDFDGVTMLHAAAAHPSARCLSLIIKVLKPGEVDTQDGKKRTALHWSAAYGNVEQTKLLLEQGANVCIPDSEGKTPFHYAVCSSSCNALECVKILLGEEPSVINWQDYEGQSGLHLSVSKGTTKLVEYLTSMERCNINILDNSFLTPLHWAAQQGLADKVAVLLDRGAFYACADGYGATPMHHAAYYNRAAAMKAFLCRSYVTDEPDFDGMNAFHWAAARRSDDVIQILSESKFDVSYKDKNGSSALHAAAVEGNISTIELLLSLGAPIDSKDDAGMTPFLRACELGRFKVTKVLLKNGAQIDATDKNHSTGLHWAGSGGYAYLCQMLIQEGCSCKIKDDFGMTPLHYASAAGYIGCVSVFLESNADPDVPDKEGRTALHLAVMNSHFSVIKLLVEYGAYLNPMAMQNQWATPMDCAIQNGKNTDIVHYLRSVGSLTSFEIESIAAKKIQIWFRYLCARRAVCSKYWLVNKPDEYICIKKTRTKENESDDEVISATLSDNYHFDDESGNTTEESKVSERNIHEYEKSVVVIQKAWRKFSLRKKIISMRANTKKVFPTTESRIRAEKLWKDSVEKFFSQL